MEEHPKFEPLECSSDKSRLDLNIVHGFLKRSAWAERRTRETLIKSIENSLCFGAYLGGRQVGFARVVTDGCTFAYLCDVFVDENFRNREISKALIAYLMKHPELQSYRLFLLSTTDAHGLYRQFGFQDAEPNRLMVKKSDGDKV